MGLLVALYGLVFLLFAVVAVFAGGSLDWIYGQFLLGVGLLAYAAFTSMGQLRARLSSGSSLRRARYGSNLILQTTIAVIILGLVAYLSVQYPKRWDWTEASVHSLTQASADLLQEIPEDRPVEVIAFFATGSETPARELLERYTYRSERLHFRIVDPNRDPRLANKFEIRANGVIVVCAGTCEAATSTAQLTEATEEELTRAIRQVIGSQKRVYALTGHGESDPDDAEPGGLSHIKKALDGENVSFEKLLLANQEDVPEDADAVVIAGPDRSLLDRELDALGRYLERGGALLVMIDPIVVTNLESRLLDWGVEVGADLIVDQQIQLFAGPQLGVQPVVTSYGDHSITEDLEGRPTLFHLARSVRARDGAESVVELALTGESSWAETDVERFLNESTVGLDSTDRPGPVALAVAQEVASEGEQAGRLVVVGDSDFARNRYIAQFYNADLMLNAVNWLIGEESFITVERNLPRASTAVITLEQFQNFRYLSIFVLPELILLVGIAVWWRRRT